MGDTRIDGSTPKNPYPECDEETGLCGEVKKPEVFPQHSRDLSENQSHVGGSDWHAPMLPDPKPAQLAQVAKNMSAPKPPTDAELRATYGKMSDAELEKEVKTLGKRLSDGGQYSGADLDTQKFHAAEAVAKSRADAARPAEKGEFTEHLLPYADGTMESGKYGTIGHGWTEWTTERSGFGFTAVHADVVKHDFGPVDLTISGDAGTVGIERGRNNADGSRGLHGSGGVGVAAVEGTLHKTGLGSITVGASGGLTAEASAGLKQEGNMLEGCVRISAGVGTFGLCIPMLEEKK
jgi:hypothetical protein